ncbi:amidohydrolase family protein [Thermosporothrix hazakensis]|nr:amidohydrolase [Thermosporothrix hazakensis]
MQHESLVLIQQCALLSPDAPGHLLPEQDILLQGNRIKAVGASGTLKYNPLLVEKVIEGKNRLAIPGLINAHTHSLENMLKATSPSLPLELWLIPLFGSSITWTPRLAYLSAMLGALEMLKSGTTAVLDHLWTVSGVTGCYLDAVMQAYHDIGIRAAVAPSIEDRDMVLEHGAACGIDFPHHPFVSRFQEWPAIDAQLETVEQFLEMWHNRDQGRLRCLVGPSGIHWCSETLLQRCLDLATAYQTEMHLHAVETEVQAQVIHKELGEGGIAYLEKQGVLKPGTSLAHAIWLDPGDLERLARTGATLVHNPVSNLRLGSGHFPFSQALDMGVTIALGCDGAASNDNQNMFDVLKLTGLMHNFPHLDYKQWPAASSILHTATCGGATAIGLSGDIGTIEAGKLADIVLLDLSQTSFLPFRDAYLHLVYCENGSAVDTVLVNGTIVIERGNATRIDEQALCDEIREHCQGSWASFSASLDSVGNTREMLTKIDTLRRFVLHRDKHDEHSFSSEIS